MNEIDWESIKKSNQHLSINERATRSKYVFRWSYTNQRDHTFYQQNTARCPLCNIEEEDQHHIQHCQDKGASKMRDELLCNLEDKLTKLKSHPDLVTLLLQSMKVRQHQRMMVDVQGHHDEFKLRPLLDSQCEIRWDKVRLGFLVGHWRIYRLDMHKSDK